MSNSQPTSYRALLSVLATTAVLLCGSQAQSKAEGDSFQKFLQDKVHPARAEGEWRIESPYVILRHPKLAQPIRIESTSTIKEDFDALLIDPVAIELEGDQLQLDDIELEPDAFAKQLQETLQRHEIQSIQPIVILTVGKEVSMKEGLAALHAISEAGVKRILLPVPGEAPFGKPIHIKKKGSLRSPTKQNSKRAPEKKIR